MKLHHLNNSRSHRVLWMLEEMGIAYDIVRYQRDRALLAPDALRRVHPLGSSPVLEDNGMVIAESGAILEYLQETYDSAQNFKPATPQDRAQYRFWLHYAEGSLMPLMVMKMVFGNMDKPPVPEVFRSVGAMFGEAIQKTWLNRRIEIHSSYIENHLSSHEWFAGDALSCADFQMSFPVMALLAKLAPEELPNTRQWLAKVEQRPAWQKAILVGGPITLAN